MSATSDTSDTSATSATSDTSDTSAMPISTGQTPIENYRMTPRDEARISILDNLFLEMAECALKSKMTTFYNDLNLLADKFITLCRDNDTELRSDDKTQMSDDKTQMSEYIQKIFSNEANKAIIENSIKSNTPNNKWRQLHMGRFFKRDDYNPKYYTFAKIGDKVLDVWLKGFELIKERAIDKLKSQSGGSKKRTTRRPLRRKSATKRLRRRRRSNRRTSRK